MIPFLVLIVSTLVLRILGAAGVIILESWTFCLRGGLFVMFLFTATAHWVKRRTDLVRMVLPGFSQARDSCDNDRSVRDSGCRQVTDSRDHAGRICLSCGVADCDVSCQCVGRASECDDRREAAYSATTSNTFASFIYCRSRRSRFWQLLTAFRMRAAATELLPQ